MPCQGTTELSKSLVPWQVFGLHGVYAGAIDAAEPYALAGHVFGGFRQNVHKLARKLIPAVRLTGVEQGSFGQLHGLQKACC